MNAQKIQNAQNNFQSNQSTQNGQFTKKTPRYKFDETWLNAISNYYAVITNHSNNANNNNANSYDTNRNGNSGNRTGHSNSYSAADLKRLINGYLEGTNDCSELYDTYFGCAWIVIKAEIDRRKARNARARERRLQRRAEKLAAAQQVSQENASTAPASLGAKATSEKAVVTTMSNVVAQSTDKIVEDELRNSMKDNAMSVSEITADENAAADRKVAKPRKAMPTDEKRMRSRCFQKSVQKIIFKKNHNSTNPRQRNANLHACCRK
jgi:hypothetical protein